MSAPALARRAASRAFQLIVVLIVAAGMCGASGTRAAARAPNIVLITADDLGLQLSGYGDTTVETPNIDSIGKDGVRFQNANVTQSSCSSSRSSMFTGTYPHQNGQVGLAHLGFTMNEAYPTVASLLHAARYRTGVIGKVHVNAPSAFAWDFQPDYKTWPERTRDVRRVADTARQFIMAASAPFFLKVSYLDPHPPLIDQVLGVPPAPILPRQITTNAWTGKPVPVAEKAACAAYYNAVKRLDIGVGMLLSVLAETGVADNTLVLFLSDNGGGPVQGGKMDIYENGIRVPFLARFPLTGRSAQVRSELVSTVDILPTILEAAGVLSAPPTQEQITAGGRSLLPLIRGESVAWRQYLFAEMNYHSPELHRPSRSVRNSRYKLIHSYPPLERGVNGIMLYDLKTDRLETRNLAADPAYSAIRDRLAAELAGWQARTDDPF